MLQDHLGLFSCIGWIGIMAVTNGIPSLAVAYLHGCRPFMLAVAGLSLLFGGCGTMKTRHATDQLLVSDAVDRSISQIDFSPLAGSEVYLDTSFLRHVGSVGFVNSAYIISALREQMISNRCVLREKKDDANYIVEVRVGALGTDGHEVNYGLPASGALNTTAALFTSTPVLPAIPEISLAKKDERRAAAKIGVFAYHRETKEPVWHPGMVKGESIAKSTWILGAGPFQQGTIYDETQFAGAPISVAPKDSPLVQFRNLARDGIRNMFHTPEKTPSHFVGNQPPSTVPSATTTPAPGEWQTVPSNSPGNQAGGAVTHSAPVDGSRASYQPRRQPNQGAWPKFRVSDYEEPVRKFDAMRRN